MTQWSPPGQSSKPDFSQFFKDDYGVILLRGKNSFGDAIYSYVKVSFPNVDRLQHCLRNRLPFLPSDFGEVVAAGKGEPSDDVKNEIARLYPIVDQSPASKTPTSVDSTVAASNAAAPAKKKEWDEY